MLPAHASLAKRHSRAAASGGGDNASRLKRLFGGLHSVFGERLDHPPGPWVCFTDADVHACIHTYSTVKHTRWVQLIQHGDPLLSAPRQLCLRGSSGNSICRLRPGVDTREGASLSTSSTDAASGARRCS